VPTPIIPTIHTFTSLKAAYKNSLRNATCGDAPPDEQMLERSSFSSSESHLESEGELGRIQMIKGAKATVTRPSRIKIQPFASQPWLRFQTYARQPDRLARPCERPRRR
jgi:hypothetical protein